MKNSQKKVWTAPTMLELGVEKTEHGTTPEGSVDAIIYQGGYTYYSYS